MAITTVYGVPDDGRKGRTKHAELLTPNKEYKNVVPRWHLYDQLHIPLLLRRSFEEFCTILRNI